MDDRPFGRESFTDARSSEPLEPVALLSRAQRGDFSAFESLVERLRDDIYGLGLRMTRSETDAAEIVQESFLSAYMHLDKLRDEAELSAWVRQVAASHACSRARPPQKTASAEKQPNLKLSDASTFPSKRRGPDWGADVTERPLSPELQRTIEEATDRLPQSHREIFLLKDVEGLSYEQIAKLTCDSISTIKDRLQQARLSLRESIDRYYRGQ